MKRMIGILALVTMLVGAVGIYPALAFNHGGPRGGGFHHGSPHVIIGPRAFVHSRGFVGPRVFVGPGFYPYPYYGYAYGYPYGYAASPVVVQQEPAGQYWYYCQDPAGYYPQVAACPSGWLQVAPTQ
jgi:hypothetical protein